MLPSCLGPTYFYSLVERTGRANVAMSSKRMFSWSKRQSNSEPYYRTGGLLPIEAVGSEPCHGFEAKVRGRYCNALADYVDVVVQDEAIAEA